MKYFFIFSVILCITIILPILLTMAPPSTKTSSMGTSSTGTSSTTTTPAPICDPNFNLNFMLFNGSSVGQNIDYFNGLYYVTFQAIELSSSYPRSSFGNVTIVGPLRNYTIQNVNISLSLDYTNLIVDKRNGDVYLFGTFFFDSNPGGRAGAIKFNANGVEQWRISFNFSSIQSPVTIDTYFNTIYYGDGYTGPPIPAVSINIFNGFQTQIINQNNTYDSLTFLKNYTLSNSNSPPFPQIICKTNHFNNITIWCRNLPAYGLLEVHDDNAYVIFSNSTATYITKFDSNGNIIYQNFMSFTYSPYEGYYSTVRTIIYYNGFIYSLLNDCVIFPCSVVLGKTDALNGISTFQVHPFITDRSSFAGAIDTNSNTLYFGTVPIGSQRVYNYSINTFCL